MGTRVIFEASAFLDFITKAGRVAPTRGSAYDKAAGIIIEIHPNDDFKAVIRSTNLDVYFTTWVSPLEVEGDSVVWRLNSETIGNIARAVRVGSGQKVTLEQVGNRLQVTQGRIKAIINLMMSQDYPAWKAFDPRALLPAGNLVEALGRVEWAAADSDPGLLIGVRFDGRNLVATDKYRVAKYPYEIPDCGETFVLKAKAISQALQSQSKMMIGFDGDFMLIMPDEQTQYKVLSLAGDYVQVDRIMVPERPCEVRVRKQAMIELINRILSVRGSDRSPLIKLRIGKGEIAGYLVNEDQGMFGDVVETPGYCDHDRFEFGFSHENLVAALTASPGDDVTLYYDINNLKKPFYIKGDQGYESWIAVRGQSS